MTPDGRAAMAREVLTELVEWDGAKFGTKDDVVAFRDTHYPTPVPPPIPLGAVVEDGDRKPWAWNGVEWHEAANLSVVALRSLASTLTALYHARRELEEERANPLRTVTVYGIGGKPSPAPSAPRRWWLVVGPDGVAVATMEREEDARAYADTRNFVRSNPAYCSVVPVLEARVTRETVERVAKMWYDADILHGGCDSWVETDEQTRDYYRTCAKMHARALGLTVEADHA